MLNNWTAETTPVEITATTGAIVNKPVRREHASLMFAGRFLLYGYCRCSYWVAEAKRDMRLGAAVASDVVVHSCAPSLASTAVNRKNKGAE